MTAAVQTRAGRIAELANRYADNPLPVVELEVRELLAGDHAAWCIWVEYTNALGALDELAHGINLGEHLAQWPDLDVEAAEGQAVAYWRRERDDAYGALVMAAGVNGRAA